jgi:large conductance mechanosensitive channel
MAAKKPAVKKSAATKTTKTAKKTPVNSTAQTVTEKNARIQRLEAQVNRLKTLDKVGMHKKIHGFVEFLREQSVVGLAIGLVLGTQAKVLIDQLIASFINPLVGLLLPGQGTLKDKVFEVHLNGKVAAFGWGAFVISLLTFLIVAAVVYFVFKGLKLDRLDKKKEV